jgi:hypothetical protein
MKYILLKIVLITLLASSCIFRKPEFIGMKRPIYDVGAFSHKMYYKYEDFPDTDTSHTYYCILHQEYIDGGERHGKIGKRKKEGKFLTGQATSDSLGNIHAKDTIYKEEYFKNGLRDSVYKRFENWELIYETTFKNGTGLWKEFHRNKQLYFEIYTKDGYFTDTLKLYNKEGVLYEKRFYNKSTLVYYNNNKWCLRYTYQPDSSTYLKLESYEVNNFKQGALRNVFMYKTKEEYKNDTLSVITIRKQPLLWR